MSLVAKFLLTGTSIAPVLMVYALMGFIEGKICIPILLACISILLSVACLIMLRYAIKNLERFDFSAKSVEAADSEIIGFMLLYLLPLFTSSFKELDWFVFSLTIFIFCILVTISYNYHVNPLLGLMRWHFYKVGTEEGVTYVLITKKQLRNIRKKIIAGQLTEYIIIDVEGY